MCYTIMMHVFLKNIKKIWTLVCYTIMMYVCLIFFLNETLVCYTIMMHVFLKKYLKKWNIDVLHNHDVCMFKNV